MTPHKFWGGNHSAAQKISNVLSNPSLHLCIQYSPPLDPIHIILPIPSSTVLHKKLTDSQLLKELRGSMAYSQQLTTDPYPEQDEFTPSTIIFKYQFKYYSPIHV
jgi:hypothetical protein